MKLILVFLCLALVPPLRAANPPALPPANGRVSLAAELDKSAHARATAKGVNDPYISTLTAAMLSNFHYSHPKLDTELSRKFLDRYLDMLDSQHLYFFQSDVAEFEKYRDVLGEMIVGGTNFDGGDTTPAYVIFNRFMQRLDERAIYVHGLLQDGPFEFTDTNRVAFNRKNQPFPKNAAAARQLWRELLRYEYLQLRLEKEGPAEIAKLIISRRDGAQLGLTWSDFHTDIVDTLSRRYGRLLRYYREWDSDKVLGTYLTALASLADPHSDFMDRATLENFTIQMSLSLFGIGAVLTAEDGYTKIRDLNHSGPAYKSGQLKSNDCIVAVAQGNGPAVDVVDMPLSKVVDLIRGSKGTEVRLTIVPADAVDRTTKEISLVRSEITLDDQSSKAKIIDLPDGKGGTNRLGVIDVPSFYATIELAGSEDKAVAKSTTADVKRLITKLTKEGVRGIILDLRRNGGGSLEEAVKLSGLFIKEGPVVQVKDSDPTIKVNVLRDTDPIIQYGGPLLLLTDRFSASASEILAGALQDYGRAVLVGDASTHGKGTVQSLDQLANFVTRQFPRAKMENPADFGALKVTTKKFYRASGSSTQLRGVNPDIVLPSIDDYLEIGETNLDNPLEWDEIASAKFDKLNLVQPYLPELRKRSEARVTAAKDFTYIREDIEKVKKTLADKSISLNELQRLKEKDEADAKAKAREAELKSRKPVAEKVYAITLKDVDLPGLPPPVGKTNGPATLGKTPGASGTNALAAAAATTPAGKRADPDDDAEAETAPGVDVDLMEAEQILMDYISLLPKDDTLTAMH